MIFVGTAGLVGYWINDNVEWHIAGWLVIGSTAGSYFGAKTMVRVPERSLRLIFGFFLLFVAIRMFFA